MPLRDDQTYIPGLLNSQGTKVGSLKRGATGISEWCTGGGSDNGRSDGAMDGSSV